MAERPPLQQEPPQQAVPHEAIHKQAFWLYGVIVGLAIKEGVVAVVPHIFDYKTDDLESWVEAARFFIFFVLIARYYLGAVLFFEEAHFSSKTRVGYPKKSFMMDFIVGLFHFLFFAALSRSIDIKNTPLRLFDVLIGLILLYDSFWYRLSRGLDTREIMKSWMVINNTTFIVSLAIYLPIKLTWGNHIHAELWALIPIAVVSLIDIGELITGKQYLGDTILGITGYARSFLVKIIGYVQSFFIGTIDYARSFFIRSKPLGQPPPDQIGDLDSDSPLEPIAEAAKSQTDDPPSNSL